MVRPLLPATPTHPSPWSTLLRRSLLVALAASAAATTGCSSQVRYASLLTAPTAPPERHVRLEVTEARPPAEGGGDPALVGTVRGGYGNPAGLRDDDSSAVVSVTTHALTDALASRGIGVRPDAPLAVSARVVRFWMDGYVGYSAGVVVDLALVDGGGGVRWSGRAAGNTDGVVFSYAAASKLLSRAASEMGRSAAAQLAGPAFEQALR
jgi:hypothetical protein